MAELLEQNFACVPSHQAKHALAAGKVTLCTRQAAPCSSLFPCPSANWTSLNPVTWLTACRMHWLACACDLQTGAKVTWRQRQHVKYQVSNTGV